jgi:hypothetical protein
VRRPNVFVTKSICTKIKVFDPYRKQSQTQRPPAPGVYVFKYVFKRGTPP